MARTEYREQLETLREDVLAMSELVCDRYEAALTALEAGDAELADEVIAGDGEVNTRYLALEHDCIDLFALQQPVAGDLRFIASSFKILTDLERVGDLATNVAAVAGAGAVDRGVDSTDQTGEPADRAIDPAVLAVGREAGDMLADAMDAYAADDAAACWAIAERDDDLDDRCEAVAGSVVADLLQADGEGDVPDVRTSNGDTSKGERPAQGRGGTGDEPVDGAVATAWQTLVLVRDVERVGDHAVNVAARTRYAVEHDDSLLF